MDKDFMYDSVKKLIEDAEIHSKRRGSATIREIDVKSAISKFPDVKPSKWFLIPVEGKGNCLFISIRILIELNYILNKIDNGEPVSTISINGYDKELIEAAQRTRRKIVKWFSKKPEKEVPQLGNFVEGENARPWKRSDLIAMEMVNRGKDIPENGPERENAIREYLEFMSKCTSWGGTPECFAAAAMTGKTLNTWQPDENKQLFKISTICGSKTDEILNEDNAEDDAMMYSDDDSDEEENDKSFNLFFRGNHYQPLVSRRQFGKLVSVFGSDLFQNIEPY